MVRLKVAGEKKQGNPVGYYDVRIAGQAVAKSLILVTYDVSEFGKVPNLTVEEGQDPSLFEGLKIMGAGEKYTSMMGKFPVIHRPVRDILLQKTVPGAL